MLAPGTLGGGIVPVQVTSMSGASFAAPACSAVLVAATEA